MPSDAVIVWVEYAKRDIELVMREMAYIRNPRLRP